MSPEFGSRPGCSRWVASQNRRQSGEDHSWYARRRAQQRTRSLSICSAWPSRRRTRLLMPPASPVPLRNPVAFHLQASVWEKTMVDEAETSRYVMLARREWSEQAPSVVEQLEDPQAFFQDLGMRAATRIGQMCEQMNAQVLRNLSYLERVGQLKAIRKQAEELVLQDLIYDPIAQAQSPNPIEQLQEVQGQAPHPRDLEMDLIEIRHEAEDLAEDEGWDEVSYTSEQKERLDWLLQVRPLIQLEATQLSPHAASEAATTLSALLAQRPQ